MTQADTETDLDYGKRIVDEWERRCELERQFGIWAYGTVRELEGRVDGVAARRQFRATIGLPEFAATASGRGDWSRYFTLTQHYEQIHAITRARFETFGPTIIRRFTKLGGKKLLDGYTSEPAPPDRDAIDMTFTTREGRARYAGKLPQLLAPFYAQADSEGVKDPFERKKFVMSLLATAHEEETENAQNLRDFDREDDPDADSDF